MNRNVLTLAFIWLFVALGIGASGTAEAATGSLGSNQPCTLAASATTCTVTVNYSFTGVAKACVWISGGSALVACSGVQAGDSFAWSWTNTNGTAFELRGHSDWPTNDAAGYQSGSLLATHSVYAIPPVQPTGTITVPSTCQLPGPVAADRCTVSLNYAFSNTPIGCIWLSGGTLFACASNGSGLADFPWVTTNATTFELRAHSNWPSGTSAEYSSAPLLATATTYAQAPVSAFPNTTFVSQNVPTSMVAGQSYPVSLTFSNAGNNTLSAAGYALGSQGPQDNNTWGLNRVALPSNVAPGQQFTISFNVTAPSAPGAYNFQWQMLQSGGPWFGALSTGVTIAVSGGVCDQVVPVGGNINQALNGSATTVCLASGIHSITQTISVPAGKTLRGAAANSTDTQIQSSVSNFSISTAAGATVAYLKLSNVAGVLPTYGVFVSGTASSANPTNLHHLDVSGHQINVAAWYASNVKFSDSTLSNPGNPNSHLADPNIWITNSDSVSLQRVTVYGGGDPGFDAGGALSGDGEIAAYDSSAVVLDGVQSFDCKTSGIYFRHCVNCIIRNSLVSAARGFGLDMVDSINNAALGNDNLLVEKNTISNSGYSASVLFLVGGITVTYRNNTFIDNNVPRNPNGTTYNGETPYGRCSGIDARGTNGTLVTSGNKTIIAGVSQPSQEKCFGPL